MFWPTPGTIVFVWIFGAFKHKGIVSNRWENGKPMVLASAYDTAGVAEISWDAFTGGKPCYIEGYPSKLPAILVLYNARCRLGQPYNVLASNCEHFVYVCHGQPAKSPQAAAVLALGLFGLIAAASRS